jgi:hypothetical protein
VDYSGIYHNTGCSGISLKLKDFGYDVEPLSLPYTPLQMVLQRC